MVSLNSFFVVIMLAITIEGLVEYAKNLISLASTPDKKPFFIQMGAVTAAIIIAILADADFYSGLGVVFAWPMVGNIFTGIFISRGSNYVSDFVGRLKKGSVHTEIVHNIIDS